MTICASGLLHRDAALRPRLGVLFGSKAELGEMSLESLSGINTTDIVVFALAATTFARLLAGAGRPRKLWMGLAILLPLAGIAVLFATSLHGSLPPNGRTLDQLPVLCASVSNSAARIKQSAATAAGVGSPSQVKEISRIASSSISITRTR